MAGAPPSEAHFTAERYLALVDEGMLGPDDRVELLEGVIVAMSPHGTRTAVAVTKVTQVLTSAAWGRATVRVQLSFLAGQTSIPEPDVAIVPGRPDDYLERHPSVALLIVEVSDSSLPQDRLTKSRIYAHAGVPEYWIVNLRDDIIEIASDPQPESRVYRERRIARRGERIELLELSDVSVAVDDLLPVPDEEPGGDLA